MPTEKRIDCPALHKRSNSYPFGHRVPRSVRMLKTVTADPMPVIGFAYIKGDVPVATVGQSYLVWTNSHGAGFMAANNGVCENCDAAKSQGEPSHEIPGTSGMRLNMLANQGE